MSNHTPIQPLRQLHGYWFVSLISSSKILQGSIHFKFHFQKLNPNYDFKTPPFLQENQIKDHFETYLPLKFLLLLKMGQLLKDGEAIGGLYGVEKYTYNIELDIGFNEVRKSSDIENIKGVTELESTISLAHLKSDMFALQAQREKFFLLCPSNELIRHLFFHGKSSVKQILDQSFSLKKEVKEIRSRKDEKGDHLYIKTTHNYQPREFLTLAQLCTDDSFLRLYNFMRAKLYYSFHNGLDSSLSGFFIKSMRSMKVLAKPIELGDEHGLFVYRILNSNMSYAFDSLLFNSEIDGRSGTNRNDPNLEQKTNSKTINKNGDGFNITTGSWDPSKDSKDVEIDLDENESLPFMKRDEKGEQKARYKTKINISNINDTSLGDQSENDEDEPDEGNLVPDDFKNLSYEQMKRLSIMLDEIAFSLDLDIEFRIVSQDNKNLSKRYFSEFFNTIPIPDIPYSNKEFACLYKHSGRWKDRRGIVVVEFHEHGKYSYLIEIEERFMKKSHEQFEVLLCHKPNFEMISDDQINSVLMICREFNGVWKKGAKKLNSLRINNQSIRHTVNLHNRVANFIETSLFN